MPRVLKCLLMLLPVLLSAWILLDAPFEDKLTTHPLENADAIEFVTDGSSLILQDPDAIALLKRAYRWTNRHAYCCLGSPDKEPSARMYTLRGGTRQPEPLRLFDDLSVPTFNLTFRWLLNHYRGILAAD